MKIAARMILILLLGGVGIGAAIFGVPTVYYGWKHAECWLRGPDSVACWELDLLKRPPGTRRARTVEHRGAVIDGLAH